MKSGKILSLILISILLISILSGCLFNFGKNNNNGKNDDDSDGTPGGKRVEADVNKLCQTLENAKAGDHITLGSWEQDNNTSNGAEAISWTVLALGVGKALILSDKIIEFQPFQKKTVSETSTYTRAIYPESDIRKYLNDNFYNNAFTDKERALIISTKFNYQYVVEYKYQAEEFEDKVFLPSVDMANKYLVGNGTIIYGIPTDYVKKFEPYMSEVKNVPSITEALTWWLMDMGDDTSKASVVNGYDSKPDTYGSELPTKRGVRPAMWIVYNENDMKAYEKGEIEPKQDAELDRKLSALKKGDTLKFGRYDFDPRMNNGYEDVEWVVLEEKDDSVLVIQKQPIGYSPYQEHIQKDEDTNWSMSDLREMINSNDFMDKLFTPQEKSKIKLTHNVTSGDEMWHREGGPETDDYLFIPDETELIKYFPEKEDQARINGSFWLRSPSFVAPYFAYVYAGGGIGSKECTENSGVVLMAWLKK